MKVTELTFHNELDNQIYMRVTRDTDGVTVYASGPDSEVEHTWTDLEATILAAMVSYVLP